LLTKNIGELFSIALGLESLWYVKEVVFTPNVYNWMFIEFKDICFSNT